MSDTFHVLAILLRFTVTFSFDRSKSDVPTIQIAFQYSVVVPPQELSDSNSGGVSTNRYGNQQRTNIRFLVFTLVFAF